MNFLRAQTFLRTGKSAMATTWLLGLAAVLLLGFPIPFVCCQPVEKKDKLSKVAQDDKKTIAEEMAEAEQARADYAKFHPLGLDQRLHARLTIIEKKPKLAELLPRMAAATGLKFTLADNIKHHNPDLGEFNLRNVRVYSFMEIIARNDIDDGHWEKTADGYRLEGGTHTPLPPRALMPQSKSGWIWFASVLALALVASGAFVLYRRRGKRAQAN
jgi:hypothetical protein